MESSIFPTAFKACVCQSEPHTHWDSSSDPHPFISVGLEDVSQFALPDATSQTFADPLTQFAYPPLELPVDPSLSPQIHAGSSLLANLSLPLPSQADTESAAWMQRLEKLEKAVEQLQDPRNMDQPRQEWSRLEALEKVTNELQSKLKYLQHAVGSLEGWAEKMNVAYKECKGAVYEVYKLVNSRQHLLRLINTAKGSTELPSRESLGAPAQYRANFQIMDPLSAKLPHLN